MAAGAGTEAAIRQALPIAQQDADNSNRTRMANQDVQNRFLENRQSTDLNKEMQGYESTLRRGEATHGTDLEMQRARNENELSMQRARNENELSMQRDSHSADLNMRIAEFENGLQMESEEFSTQLKLDAERILNDDKYSDEIKLQYVNNINNIMRDAQQQITEIGMSDRSAAQQAEAIELVQMNRDANMAVYQDLLNTFDDWDWGTNFTPERVTEPSNDGTVRRVMEEQGYSYNDRTGEWYQPRNSAPDDDVSFS